ncbi:hypothetical protein BJ508DRAFT_136424 [Ascobolus immersus RN42]|uniref:Uncharacterized protein n=1 Tax=Ascobolus immersus RN42 TaxID=1160509 RepID=A0A3N4IKH5_ASCIM|nr:hypothetical protein BJ508DRAFT_136424 [Ascobolus immersus RN42]
MSFQSSEFKSLIGFGPRLSRKLPTSFQMLRATLDFPTWKHLPANGGLPLIYSCPKPSANFSYSMTTLAPPSPRHLALRPQRIRHSDPNRSVAFTRRPRPNGPFSHSDPTRSVAFEFTRRLQPKVSPLDLGYRSLHLDPTQMVP